MWQRKSLKNFNSSFAEILCEQWRETQKLWGLEQSANNVI